jgi:hypothetical protein
MDDIVIGPADVTGTYWGAFARVNLDVGDTAGPYTAARHRSKQFITHPTDAQSSDGSYHLQRTIKGCHYSGDAYQVDTCHARVANEGMTEAEENCILTVKHGQLVLEATRPILQGEALLTRYGFRFWLHARWPLHLLKAMFTKYTAIVQRTNSHADVINPAQVKEWRTIIAAKERELARQREFRPTSILRRPIVVPPLCLPLRVPPPPKSPQQRIIQRRRKTAQKSHRLAVQRGQALPRTPPVPSSPPPLLPDFTYADWLADLNPTMTTEANFCTMAWSSYGSLCPVGLRANIPAFLRRVATLIRLHSVDCCYITDAHFLLGELDAYLPALLALLPDSRVFQFPTTRVHTNSRTESNNRMGGTLAIVSSSWAGFVVTSRTYTDPMGLGIVNALDFCARDYKICSVNAYFPPLKGGTGPATLHASITRHQHRSEMPSYVKRQNPNEFVRSLTQRLVAKKKLDGYTVVLTGDLNDKHASLSFQAFAQANDLAKTPSTLRLELTHGSTPGLLTPRHSATRPLTMPYTPRFPQA